MIIAHLSDLHICRHGTRLTQIQDVARRAMVAKGWETIRVEGDWRIQARADNERRLLFRQRFRLIDDVGAVHRVVRVRRGRRARQDAIDALLAHMEARDRTTPQRLSQGLPSGHDLDLMLSIDPDNINLRFCALAWAMRRAKPDHIVVTGDLTDDAEGFELILAGLEPFFEAGRVSFVPGNHDLYASPPLWVSKAQRKTDAEKRMLWATFATSVGMPASGSHVRELGDGLLLVCLDSCVRAKVPGSASGLVPLRDLHAIARDLDTLGKHVRIACLHHHVLNPPVRGMGLAPLQAGF